MKPTGNTRYRIERRGFWRPRYMLVLQVEETGSVMRLIVGCVDRVNVTRWRDAQVGDVSTVHGAHYGDSRLVFGV